MTEADQLRAIAAGLRKEAAAIEQRKMEKCAHVIDAALALALLKEKVKNHVR